LMEFCVHPKRINLMLGFLGWFFKEGHRATFWIFNSIIEGFCWENIIGDALVLVLEKMPKLECEPNLYSYTIRIDGLQERRN
jgi:PPR repeat family